MIFDVRLDQRVATGLKQASEEVEEQRRHCSCLDNHQMAAERYIKKRNTAGEASVGKDCETSDSWC